MSFHAYILRCVDGSYYTGHTDDLDKRVAEHQSGSIARYTHSRRPVEMAWSESFPTREEAIAAELRLKGWSRRKKEALIRGDWETIREEAIPPHERALRLRSGRTEGGNGAQTQHSVFADPAQMDADPLVRVRSEGAVAKMLASPPTSVRAERSRSTHPHAPVIVLVRPQLGENIGKAARAMLNFGLGELRLVTPRDGWPNPAAGPAASGADRVLADAQVFDSVAAAVADCAHVYATTVRRRGVTKPVVTPAAAASAIHAAPGRSAILFGPERSGLESDDVAVARTIVTVPINPAFGSLNLAQAVILVAYEWSKGVALASPPAVAIDPPAPQAELDGMIGQLDALLEAADFYFPPQRETTVRRTIRTLLTRPGWTSQEVRTLRGVFSALEPKRRG